MRKLGMISLSATLLAVVLLWSHRSQTDTRAIERVSETSGSTTEHSGEEEMAKPSAPVPRRTSLEAKVEGAPYVEELKEALWKMDEEPEVAEIFGNILTSEGLRLERGRVLVFASQRRGEPIQVLELDGPQREFRCTLPAGKAYRLIADPTALEGDYSPPLARSLSRRAAPDGEGGVDWTRFSFAYVELIGGDSLRQDVTVGLPAQVAGRLLAADGEPLPDVHAQLLGITGMLAGLTEDCITGLDGEFQFQNVFPGDHRLHFSRAEAWTPPAPIDLTLLGGESRWLGDIRLARSGRTIRGAVVDQDGRPFPGLPILCFSNVEVKAGTTPHNFHSALAQAVTGSDGSFLLEHLPAIPVQVSLTPDFEPRKVHGAGHPAMWEPNLQVDLTQGPALQDVGSYTVEESRPFEISGKVLFDEVWLAKEANKRSHLQGFLSRVAGQELPEGIRRASLNGRPFQIDPRSGEFRILVETPSTDLELHLELDGYVDRVITLQPLALGEWWQEIRVPADFQKP